MAGSMTAKVAASVRDYGTVLVYGALVLPDLCVFPTGKHAKMCCSAWAGSLYHSI